MRVAPTQRRAHKKIRGTTLMQWRWQRRREISRNNPMQSPPPAKQKFCKTTPCSPPASPATEPAARKSEEQPHAVRARRPGAPEKNFAEQPHAAGTQPSFFACPHTTA